MEDCPKVIHEGLVLLSNIKVIAFIILILFSLASTAFNTLLTASFIATKQINKNTTNFLIFVTSINDLLASCFLLPIMAIIIYLHDSTLKCSQYLKAFMALVVLVRYSGKLTYLITLDRFLHMNPNVLTISKWRERFMKFFKRPQVYFVLLFSAIIAVLYSWYFHTALYFNEELQGVLQLLEAILGLLGLSILSGFYFKGYSGIRKHVVQSSLHSNETSRDPSHRARYLQRLSKTVLLLVSTMLVTYVPFYIATGIIAVTSLVKMLHMTKWVGDILRSLFPLMCSNGIFNSMIALYRNKEAKRWLFENMLGRGCRKRIDASQGQSRTQQTMGERVDAT